MDSSEVASGIEEVPAGLPYEIQHKLFEQMTTLGTAGAGLTITLIGSVLKGAGFLAWMSVIWFGLAALVSLAAQMSLAEALFNRTSFRRTGRIMAMAGAVLLGMGVGSLGAGVLLLGKAV